MMKLFLFLDVFTSFHITLSPLHHNYESPPEQQKAKKMVETRGQYRRRVTWDKVESTQGVFSDILSRLSVRSIRSLKSVNRYWHGSISEKCFAKKQLAQSRKKPSYIACPSMDKAMKFYLLKPGRFNFQHHTTVDPLGRSVEHYMYMISSFNGLVCCINRLSVEYGDDFYDLQIWICNPSTEERLLLPQGRLSYWTEPCIGVAYGPGISEYKIFRIFCVGEENTEERALLLECEVYSSSTGAWRGIGPVPHLPMHVCFSPHRSGHVFAGGKIYWLVCLEDPGKIICVDMEERFEVMELPQYSKELREEDRITVATYLINLKGSLSLVVLHADYFDIWVWKEDSKKSSWELVSSDDLPFMDYEIVLSITSSESEMLFATGTNLWTYDLDTGNWKRRSRPPSRFRNPSMFPFTESLLPCDGRLRLEGK